MNTETIPASELLITDEASSPKLSGADVFRILSKRVYRGLRICQILAPGLAVMAGVSFALHRVSWGVASLAVGIHFSMGLYYSRRRLGLVRLLCAEPALVYWAHPTVWRQQVQSPIRRRTVDHTFINLHLRTGHCFNIGMSRKEMRAVVTWLHRENPAVRLGEYDSIANAGSGSAT